MTLTQRTCISALSSHLPVSYESAKHWSGIELSTSRRKIQAKTRSRSWCLSSWTRLMPSIRTQSSALASHPRSRSKCIRLRLKHSDKSNFIVSSTIIYIVGLFLTENTTLGSFLWRSNYVQTRRSHSTSRLLRPVNRATRKFWQSRASRIHLSSTRWQWAPYIRIASVMLKNRQWFMVCTVLPSSQSPSRSFSRTLKVVSASQTYLRLLSVRSLVMSIT